MLRRGVPKPPDPLWMLAGLTRELRQVFTGSFGVTFGGAPEPTAAHLLNRWAAHPMFGRYWATQFDAPGPVDDGRATTLWPYGLFEQTRMAVRRLAAEKYHGHVESAVRYALKVYLESTGLDSYIALHPIEDRAHVGTPESLHE